MQYADHPVATEAAKLAPPAAVTAANFWGIAVPDVINFLTLIYVCGLVIG